MCAVAIALALFVCVAPSDAAAQTASELANSTSAFEVDTIGGGAVTPEFALLARDSLQRPPAKHSTDWVDVVEFPLKVIGWPLDLVLLRFPAWLVANITAPRPPSFITRGYRAASEWGFVPVIKTNIGPRSSVAIEQQLTHFDPFYVHAAISQRMSQRHRMGVQLGGNTNWLTAEAKWQRDAQMRFHGIGSQTSEHPRSFLRRDWWDVVARTGLTISPFLSLTGEVAYEHNIIDEQLENRPSILERFPLDSLYGVVEQTEYARFALGGTLDLTHWDNFQQKGVLVGVEGRLFFGLSETDSKFRSLRSFVNTYLPLNPQQTLAFRVVSQIERDDGGSNIPFYHLSSLGGSRSALGFPTSRFVDNDMVSLMSEYRYEVWRELHSRMRAETFLFLHYGAVGETLGQIESGDWHPSYGLGLRLSQPTMLMAVAYLGFSSEGMTAGIRTSWPF